MTSLLATIALVCCAFSPPDGRGPVTAAEAFVTPPVIGNHNRDTAAPVTPLRRPSYGQVETLGQAAAAPRGRSNRNGEQQQQPLTMSSRLNGADVSEDLSQLNGAAAAAVPSQNTVRVSFSVKPICIKKDRFCAEAMLCRYGGAAGVVRYLLVVHGNGTLLEQWWWWCGGVVL